MINQSDRGIQNTDNIMKMTNQLDQQPHRKPIILHFLNEIRMIYWYAILEPEHNKKKNSHFQVNEIN